MDGLTDNFEGTDFGVYVHLARPKERSGIFTLGALSLGVLSTSLSPNAQFMVPIEFATEYPTQNVSYVPKAKENPDATK